MEFTRKTHPILNLSFLYGEMSAGMRMVNLTQLKEVDALIDMLATVENMARRTSYQLHNLGLQIRDNKYKSAYGDTARIVLEKCEKQFKQQMEDARKYITEAIADVKYDQHRDDLTSALEACFAKAAETHQEAVEVRWLIMEHDADLEEPVEDKAYSAEELIKKLGT